MKSSNHVIFIVVILTFALLSNFGFLRAPAVSGETPEQKRTECIQECQMRFWPPGNLWLAYYRCIDNCEKKFWHKWQKDMNEMEKEEE
ncbi:MAG: hypothetical protein ACP5U1_06755 [Desulfomonilaceae bacterium]